MSKKTPLPTSKPSSDVETSLQELAQAMQQRRNTKIALKKPKAENGAELARVGSSNEELDQKREGHAKETAQKASSKTVSAFKAALQAIDEEEKAKKLKSFGM